MSKDYYKTLGVDKGATDDQIKKAFRELAMKHHPDKKGGDEAKFKEINEAYQTLSDKGKRSQYDRFGSAGPNMGGGQPGGGFGGGQYSYDFNGGQGFDFGGIDLEDLINNAFGGFGRSVRRGQDYQIDIEIEFKDALSGIHKEINVPDFTEGAQSKKTKNVTITIPAGVESGQRLKLQGYGGVVANGNPGDLYIAIHVKKHAHFRREGANIAMDLDVKLTDAILGIKKEITMPDDSKLKVKIPEGLKSGEILRVRGEGVKGGHGRAGDLLIYTRILIPKSFNKEAKKAIEILQKEGL